MTGPALKSHPKTDLPLSAVADLLPEDVAVATYVERQLARIDLYRSQGFNLTAKHIADRLCDFILDPPENRRQRIIATERDEMIVTESELRLLDGNR